MKYSKRQVAAVQIDAAIDHFFLRSSVCAITLAGAAEYSMPDPSDADKSLFFRLLIDGPEKLGMSKKEVIAKINEARDWLKHFSEDEPVKDFDWREALFMILRAYSKFYACYGDDAVTARMLEFEDWVRANCPEIVCPHKADQAQ